MYKFSKLLLVGAVAVMAIAVSAAPSEAAKKKRMGKSLVPMSACTWGTACTMPGTGVVHTCSGGNTWVAVLLPACMGPGCPPPCI